MSDAAAAARRAAGWLAAQGDTWSCRCARLLDGPAAGDAALEALAQEPASVPEALAQLQLLDDLSALRGARAESVGAWLAKRQGEDGSFSPAGDAPEAACIVATAHVAGLLGKTPFVRPALLDAAGAYLARRWAPERVQGFALPAVAAWSVFFANVPHELCDEALQWCGRELERGYRTRHFGAIDTGRVLAACDAAALPGGRVSAPEVVASLLAAQSPDGSFEGQPDRTWDALVVLAKLG